MSKRSATPSEIEECKKIYKEITKVLEGHDITAILNMMCFFVGELGIDLDMSKQAFIAQAVEQISSAYDMHKLASSEPEGEA